MAFSTADTVNIDTNQNIKINYNNHIVRAHTHDYLYNNNGKVKLYDNTNNVSKTSKSFSIDYLVNNTNCDFNDIKVYALYADSRLVNNDSGTCVINSGYYKSVGTVVNNNSTVTINNATAPTGFSFVSIVGWRIDTTDTTSGTNSASCVVTNYWGTTTLNATVRNFASSAAKVTVSLKVLYRRTTL